MIIIVILIVFTLVANIQIRCLVRNKEWKELTAFGFFYLIGLTLTILYALDVNLPSPILGISYVVRSILKLEYVKE